MQEGAHASPPSTASPCLSPLHADQVSLWKALFLHPKHQGNSADITGHCSSVSICPFVWAGVCELRFLRSVQKAQPTRTQTMLETGHLLFFTKCWLNTYRVPGTGNTVIDKFPGFTAMPLLVFAQVVGNPPWPWLCQGGLSFLGSWSFSPVKVERNVFRRDHPDQSRCCFLCGLWKSSLSLKVCSFGI